MRRLLITVDAVGGVWQYALDLARALVPHGYRTVFALMGPPPTIEQAAAATAIAGAELIDTGLDLDWLAPDPTVLRAAGTGIATLARQVGADIVQLNMPALAAVAHYPVPVVAVAHSCVATWWAAVRGDELPADFAWRARFIEEGLRRADQVVAPSHAFAELTRHVHNLPALPVVVHNGRASLPLPTVAPHDFAFTAGRLWDGGKNVATLDQAAGMLGIPLKAAGATRGPQGESVHFDNLHLLGQIDEATLAHHLAARPLFVSAARYEPFGLAVLEAAAAGCPLILSDIPTFRELWDGVAVFVAPDDAAGFAEAIDGLASDTGRRLEQGEAARRHAARYTTEATAAAMAALYHRLSGQSSSGKAAA